VAPDEFGVLRHFVREPFRVRALLRETDTSTSLFICFVKSMSDHYGYSMQLKYRVHLPLQLRQGLAIQLAARASTVTHVTA
jgi:hypothetical protein